MPFGLALLGLLVAGCGAGKTPEEIEAEKYPKAKPLTPEEQAKNNSGLDPSKPSMNSTSQ
ncbi:MAG: hypothetical protein EON58_22025 [Alphaproteobacteria bacterium]|nr:MAG: hypothetical protein EON58_22025 [Alphaproteobacteria bacterium]